MNHFHFNQTDMQLKFLLPILLVLTAVFSVSTGCAIQRNKPKPQSGIYLTASDYLLTKLSLANPCGKDHKIKLNDFWGSHHITVMHEGQKYRFNKDSIYAYQDCKGKVFRFFSNYSNEYEILEKKTVTVYSNIVNEGTGKGIHAVTRYYFSVLPDSAIKPLTLENVKNAFPDNHALHNELDKYFRSDAELCTYDARHKAFRINHILGETTFLH